MSPLYHGSGLRHWAPGAPRLLTSRYGEDELGRDLRAGPKIASSQWKEVTAALMAAPSAAWAGSRQGPGVPGTTVPSLTSPLSSARDRARGSATR